MTVTREKTWSIYRKPTEDGLIPATGDVDTTNRTVMYWILQGLLAAPAAWTVLGSSNSVAFGMDGVNRWLSYTNIVWAAAGTAHSWIVLKQTGIASNFQICIDCNAANTNTELCSVTVSYANNFTGGSLTARPTAVNECRVFVNTENWGAYATNYSYKIFVAKTTDGECTRVIINAGTGASSISHRLWMIEKPKNPHPSWTQPVYCSIGLATTYTNLIGTTLGFRVPLFLASSAYLLSNWTSLSYSGGIPLFWQGTTNLAFQVPGTMGNWLLSTIGVHVPTSGSYRGKYGDIFDMWFVPSFLKGNFYIKGDGGAWRYVILGNVLQPWDEINPLFLVA